ncbi:PLP-dependent aminotransferase family protein [Acidiferrimicrobium sp. IK]|uniref:aminotransferase-like domain-containing protein n=1 Tax=Acidiferrimicrobium sp. IK TaxID=2871700 RepID=UPI0021CB819B|nr:PLP-dependent aminotransferase family protein [Acidiferrimicrobium sp. IK]MCU4185243.1 PLP-dependent aminotransferase family protein [Acidiferrimicrobium sp. IK]
MDGSRLRDVLAPGIAAGPRAGGLVAALRSAIVEGRVLPGYRLPAERSLAVSLGLSRSTVTAAYDQLRGEGYLISRRGSGTFAALPDTTSGWRPDDAPADAASAPLDLTIAAMPAPPLLAEVAAAAAAALPAYLAGSGLAPAGLAELREVVARRYSERGWPTSANEVLITSGALHAWDLLLRTVARPGAVVAMEQPTYPGVIDAALAHRARIRPVVVDAAGWHPGEAADRPAVLAHLTFDGHNPTGQWAPDAERERVLASFDSSTVVAVDESLLDFRHDAPVTSPAALLGRAGATVVAIGTMSKSFWAGLRVGWIRGPAPLIHAVAATRAGQDLSAPVLEQLIAAGLIGRRSEVLPARRATVAGRRQVLLDALAVHCPAWHADPPAGGLAAWVDLGGGSSSRLADEARHHGVRVTPGPRFTVHGTHDRWVRIPFVLPPQQLEDAIRRLAAAAVDLQPARPRRHAAADKAWTA